MCLAMGSSLTVTPAADIPAAIGRRRYVVVLRSVLLERSNTTVCVCMCHSSSRLVIVNLQATPLNEIADLVIHATCDDVMRAVMAALAVDIPPFRLFRYINAGHTVTSRGVTLAVEGTRVTCGVLKLLVFWCFDNSM